MTHTLTYHSIQNVQLCHPHFERGIGPYTPAWAHTLSYTPAPAWAHAHAYTPAPARAYAHAYTPAPAGAHALANATAPHPPYCAADSTHVICKITLRQRRSPSKDDLVKSNRPPLHQDWMKDLFDVCVWKQAGLV
ncbi:hypothetical protein O181_034478 [Austropuccinia psidii MF-1]|uniref:Uncharacterized protein n=1 Tax=Austropuccinia psidii MF-1 TaxID=1389203 RepID=A0A9Q3D3J5_9BASI|nr:hypothetical protein [Austropuccinia psidii MF-1]